MRKKNSLSIVVAAIVMVAFSVNLSVAQTGDATSGPSQFKPPMPKFTPASSTATQQQSTLPPAAPPIQEDVEVPSILSGKQETKPAAPARIPTRPPAIQGNPLQENTLQQPQAAPVNSGMPAFRPQALPAAPANQDATANATHQTVPFQKLEGDTTPAISRVSASEALNSLRGQQIETMANTQELDILKPTLTSATRETNDAAGLSSTDGPKLRVTSVGPSSVTIGKPARFEVLVENLEAKSASSVIVGVDFPEWIEVTSAMPSTGSKELTGNTEEPLMVWQIPIVEARTTEKILIDVIPREARPFDIDVEWTFKPIRGKTTVEVTQPQLSIQISGPTEVQFGEKALYDVTVSNPGTGIAENVNVMLPEALGGERAKLDDIEPQQMKKFQVELIARSAGTLDLTTTVVADGDLKESDTREIVVRRAVLDVAVDGPPMKYAGSIATYKVTISNQGDAMAREVIAAVALPPGVEFVSGIDNVEKIDGGIRWNVGMLSPGNQRTYQINCNMTVAGEITVDAAAQGAGDLRAIDNMVTRIDAVADLVLAVADPKGPLPTGEKIAYEIRITNRGTRSARGIDVVMHFSEGVEPVDAEGIAHEIAPGQVTFAQIAQIDPGQDIVLKVLANASEPGSHRFRAQLLCEEADSHEVAEGTTRFFGNADTSTAETESDSGFQEFKR